MTSLDLNASARCGVHLACQRLGVDELAVRAHEVTVTDPTGAHYPSHVVSLYLVDALEGSDPITQGVGLTASDALLAAVGRLLVAEHLTFVEGCITMFVDPTPAEEVAHGPSKFN